MNSEQMPGWYFAHAQDDLNLPILHMFEDTFSLDIAHLEIDIDDGSRGEQQEKTSDEKMSQETAEDRKGNAFCLFMI